MLTHFIFNTYKNKKSLKDKEFSNFLKQTFYDIANEKGYKIVSCEITEDHVHMLMDYPPRISMPKLMQSIKGISSRKFFQNYPSNRLVDRKLWARSYHFRKVKAEEAGRVIGYIKGQKDKQGEDKRYARS